MQCVILVLFCKLDVLLQGRHIGLCTYLKVAPRRVLFIDVKRVRWCLVSSNVNKESKRSFQCWVKRDIIVENSDPRNERTDLEFSMAGYEKGLLWP